MNTGVLSWLWQLPNPLDTIKIGQQSVIDCSVVVLLWLTNEKLKGSFSEIQYKKLNKIKIKWALLEPILHIKLLT